MEEEMSYSAVSFKSGAQLLNDQKQVQTIYSEVKINAPAPEETTPAPAALKGDVNTQRCNLLAPSVVTLGFLLLVTISLLIYFVVINNEMIIEKNVLEIRTEELMRQKSILENQTDELIRQRDSLNWTMGRIKMLKSFDDFCLQPGCPSCLTEWMEFQEKCYFFYNQSDGWRTWTESRTYCQDNGADLVVIETSEEQEFISKNIDYYYGPDHGFLIGLKHDAGQNWSWVNGQKETLGFWLDKKFDTSRPYALVLPGKPPNASWNTSDNAFKLKFICEGELMIKTF